jgi:hypothetical protein
MTLVHLVCYKMLVGTCAFPEVSRQIGWVRSYANSGGLVACSLRKLLGNRKV